MNKELSVRERLSIGVISGFFGGIVFGLLLGPLGLLPEIAELVGSGLTSVGFVVHMLISMAFGAIFGFSFAGRFTQFRTGLALGASYGIFWWIVGGLTLLPLLLGLDVQYANALTPKFILSLIGHLAYGTATGLSLSAFMRYEKQPKTTLAYAQ